MRQSRAPAADSQALQQRVLAQWQQRHAQQGPQDQPTLLASGPALLLGQTAQDWVIKKGAVWWLRSRQREGVDQTIILSVTTPEKL